MEELRDFDAGRIESDEDMHNTIEAVNYIISSAGAVDKNSEK